MHDRACACASCRGRRNRRKGRDKQAAFRRLIGIPPTRYASQMGHEENWRGEVRVEVKAGAQVGPIATRFLAAEAQSEAARAIGDNRPFAMGAMPDGMTDGIMLCRATAALAVARALVEQAGDADADSAAAAWLLAEARSERDRAWAEDRPGAPPCGARERWRT